MAEKSSSKLSRRAALATIGGTAMATLAGCSSGSGNTTSTTTTSNSPPKNLSITPGHAPVGDTVTVTGSNLPKNTTLKLEWERINGSWQVIQQKTVGEMQFNSTYESKGTVTTDSNGSFSKKVTVPEDHGGKHKFRVVNNGTPAGQGTFHVKRQYTIESKTAALGEEFTVKVKGMRYSEYRRVGQILWDEGFAGYITATTTKGTATAKIPAAGPVGKHMLEVSGGHMSPYLNPQQSPYPRNPRLAKWEVTVTPPKMNPGDHWKRPQITETPIQAFYPNVSGNGSVSVSNTSGVVGSNTTVHGSGFKSKEQIVLKWATMSGSRVTSGGFKKKYSKLATVTADSNGKFSQQITIPDDLGGTHPIVAEVGGKKTAVTGFVIQPSVVDFTPKEGPIGTKGMIHLKGVGWTEADNSYAAMYDNDYVGYGCGFNTGGDVKIQFEASGQPGYHSLNCFPIIYKRPNQKRNVSAYNRPQLTYMDDHPIRTPPAFGFLFKVTK